MVQGLWADYLFLTKEMGHFLDKQDMDLFYELMEQRGKLQAIIENTNDESFCASASGRELLQTIQKNDHRVMLKLQYHINQSRNQHTISNAYDNLGTTFVGKRMDRQT